MASSFRPKLRSLSARRLAYRGETFAALEDPLGAFTDPVLIPIEGFDRIVRHFNGESSLDDIQARVHRETGEWIPADHLEQLVARLDRELVLEGGAFAAYAEAYHRDTVRPAAFAGRSYAGTAKALDAQLRRFFEDERGAGVPAPPSSSSGHPRLRGIISPHIDFTRGGHVYTWAYRELAERSDADTFVILGVAHQACRQRFSLTRKNFETPLGTVSTSQAYVDRLTAYAGEKFFDDELVHRTEHSVEFQAVFLQHLLGNRRPFTIVPILVGSFHDLMANGADPMADTDVRGFIEALRRAESESDGRTAYIGAIDLCHVGPEFGDPNPVDAKMQETVRRFDRAMIESAAAGDAPGWFETAAEVGNRWRVCGLSATYTMLQALGPTDGRILKYDQAIDARRACCVSFASLAFDEKSEISSRSNDHGG